MPAHPVNLRPAQAALLRCERTVIATAKAVSESRYRPAAAATAILGALSVASARLAEAAPAIAGQLEATHQAAQALAASLARAGDPAPVLVALAQTLSDAHRQAEAAATAAGALLLPQVSGLPKEDPPQMVMRFLSLLS